METTNDDSIDADLDPRIQVCFHYDKLQNMNHNNNKNLGLRVKTQI